PSATPLPVSRSSPRPQSASHPPDRQKFCSARVLGGDSHSLLGAIRSNVRDSPRRGQFFRTSGIRRIRPTAGTPRTAGRLQPHPGTISRKWKTDIRGADGPYNAGHRVLSSYRGRHQASDRFRRPVQRGSLLPLAGRLFGSKATSHVELSAKAWRRLCGILASAPTFIVPCLSAK